MITRYHYCQHFALDGDLSTHGYEDVSRVASLSEAACPSGESYNQSDNLLIFAKSFAKLISLRDPLPTVHCTTEAVALLVILEACLILCTLCCRCGTGSDS